MNLKVTKEHIQAGLRRSNDACPVALAMIAVGYLAVSVSPSFMRPEGESWGGANVAHSKPLQKWIAEFDLGRPVEPHTFRIRGLKAPAGAS